MEKSINRLRLRLKLFTGNDVVIYTGEINNLQRRAGEHERGGLLGQGHSYEYKEADGRSTSRTRREYEQKRIAENDPPLNRSEGGEGRPAE
ncbi:MAG: hypothetical protein FWC70_13380 [Defluviitaleaceae bacterium]|nr:hypothetical protein [Defluviitaleaceae bacterium]